MNINNVLRSDRRTRAVLGVTAEEFRVLIPLFEHARLEIARTRPGRKQWRGAGRKGKLKTPEHRLFFVLFYLKAYPTFDILCALFDRDLKRGNQDAHAFMAALEKALGRRLVLPKRKIRSMQELVEAFPDVKDLIVDGMERRMRRPSRPSSNRKHYSGKKKAHTRKALIVADTGRRIGILTPSKSGRRHDKRLLDKSQILSHVPLDRSVIGDTGFQGMSHPGACTPIKQTKKRPLTETDRAWNTLLSSIRISVEHAIGGMKRFRAVSDVYRNRKPYTDDIFNLLAAGLWNYHLSFRG